MKKKQTSLPTKNGNHVRQTRHHSQRLHVYKEYLHWGGFSGEWIFKYAIHGVFGMDTRSSNVNCGTQTSRASCIQTKARFGVTTVASLVVNYAKVYLEDPGTEDRPVRRGPLIPGWTRWHRSEVIFRVQSRWHHPRCYFFLNTWHAELKLLNSGQWVVKPCF